MSVPPVDLGADLSLRGTDGSYALDVPRGWEGAPGTVYGGYLAAAVVRAAGMVTSALRPASLGCQFVRPCTLDGPLRIDVASLRRGRTSDLLHVAVSQREKLCVEADVRAVDSTPGLEFEPERVPALTDPDDLPLLVDVIREQGGNAGGHLTYLEYRTSANESDWRNADGKRALTGWVRYAPRCVYDDPFLEAARVLVPIDTQVPAAFDRAQALWGPPRGGTFFGTTLDLFVHFHRALGTEWLYYETHAPVAHDGLASGHAQIWSSRAELLATGISQVAFVPVA